MLQKLRIRNGFGGNVVVQSCSCKHIHRAHLGWCSLWSVCSVLACIYLLCCITIGCLGFFFHGTVILFGFKQECCMLTDDILLLEKGGCALPLLCIAVFLHLSHLCSVPLPGCGARVPFSGGQASMDPSPSIPVHGTPACASSVPPDSHTWKQTKSLPSHSTKTYNLPIQSLFQ